MNLALLDALSSLVAGRFIRARKAAESVLERETAMRRNGETLVYSSRLRALTHLLAAESAQALQDKDAREDHFKLALEESTKRDAQETREGLQLRAARWALEDHDPQGALQCLKELPLGAARRTVALRLRLKAARMARETLLALETARLLAKHRAFSSVAAQGILRGLALELISTAHDPDQMQSVWQQLDADELRSPAARGRCGTPDAGGCGRAGLERAPRRLRNRCGRGASPQERSLHDLWRPGGEGGGAAGP